MPTQAKQKLVIEMTEADYEEYTESYSGVCLGCGEIQEGGCEPDAERYPCDACEKPRVYGVEQALLMGRIMLVSPKPSKEDPSLIDHIKEVAARMELESKINAIKGASGV